MAHDSFNTRGGEVGFFVEYADGSRVTEREATWAEVDPERPIVAAGIELLRTKTPFVRLTEFSRFFFTNEAASLRDSQKSTHTAKIVGGVKADGTVRECRVEFVPGESKPRRSQVEPYPMEAFPYAAEGPQSVLRPGV